MIGLSAARALADDGFAVTVYERDRVGSRLASSPGRSRIYRRSYRLPDYVRLARRAIEEWQRLDAGLLRNTGLLEYGAGVELHAAAMDACGEEYRWLEPAEAAALFPEAHFPEPVLYDHVGGAVMADEALQRLRQGTRRARGASRSTTRASSRRTWSWPAPARGSGRCSACRSRRGSSR